MQISESAVKNMKIDETGNTAHLCDSGKQTGTVAAEGQLGL